MTPLTDAQEDPRARVSSVMERAMTDPHVSMNGPSLHSTRNP